MKKLAVGMMAVAMGACGQDPSVTKSANKDQATIIGGFDITGKNLDAVGSLAIVDPRTGEHFSICTATLIAPQTILTAKHCTVEFGDAGVIRYLDVYDMAFDVGNDSNNARSFELVQADFSPVNGTGALGLGNDVAIYHTKTPVTDVQPIAVQAGLTEDLVGQKATAIGYGIQTEQENFGAVADNNLRKGGATTISALTGNFLALVGVTFEEFTEEQLAALAGFYGPEFIAACQADPGCAADLAALIQEWWNSYALQPGYEFWAGRQSGDVLTCFGDSGGPLLKKINNVQTVLGVVSYGTGSDQTPCDYGTVYASFGPQTAPWLAANTNWTDPCGDVTVAGHCEGNTAVRCSGKGEGARAVQQFDCSLVDQTCAVNDEGRVGCGDTGSKPGSNVSNQLVAPSAAPARVFAHTRVKAKFDPKKVEAFTKKYKQ